LQLWERWIAFVRQIEITTASFGNQPDSADSIKLLNEQAQGAIDLNKIWAQLWVDSLEHSSATINTLVNAGNRQFGDYQSRTQDQFEVLAEQVRELARQARILDVRQGWVRQWIESLDRDQSIVTAMIAWNRQIIERQAEARKQFLDSWSETFQSFDPFRRIDDAFSRQSLEVLQAAVNKAMTIPFGSLVPVLQRDEKPVSSARRSHQDRVKTA
jgi:hypothetical protein